MARRAPATKKKAAGKKKVASSRSTALVTREDLKRQLAAGQQESILGDGGAGNVISTEGGTFTYKGEKIGDSMIVVIMAYAQAFQWFDRPYDKDNPAPPACFALGQVKPTDMVPHEDAPVPQHENCAECWANQWESSDHGKGKACGNRYRLCVLAPDDLEGDMPMVSVSPSGYRGFEEYVKKVERNYGTHPAGVLTELTFSDDTNPTVIATCLGEYDDATLAEYLEDAPEETAIMAAVLERRDEANETILEHGFPVDLYEPPPTRGRGAKKKAASKKKAKTRARR